MQNVRFATHVSLEKNNVITQQKKNTFKKQVHYIFIMNRKPTIKRMKTKRILSKVFTEKESYVNSNQYIHAYGNVICGEFPLHIIDFKINTVRDHPKIAIQM